MMSTSIRDQSPSALSSNPSRTSTESSSATNQEPKQGQPNQWSASRQRQLARLYAYTNLPREDIPRPLKDDGNKWAPFGNTVLHMLAARGASLYLILKALQMGVDGNARNTAGQNFLHVLSRRTMKNFASDYDMLLFLLQRLNAFNINFLDRDIFGRSFFHRLDREARKSSSSFEATSRVLYFLRPRLPCGRDALGWKIKRADYGYYIVETIDLDQTKPNSPLRPFSGDSIISVDRKAWDFQRPYNQEVSANTNVPRSESSLSATPAVAMVDWRNPKSSVLVYQYHARLLETANNAIKEPEAEDAIGRNGLRCLAEASLDMDSMEEEDSHKRKRGQSKPPSSHRLLLCYELAEEMIAAGVDVNNYDVHGETVLMAFVTHLPDGVDDKILTKLFKLLISNGANTQWHNRCGKSALHIAMRLGRKIATRVLLECGANVHARTSEGKGLLTLGETHYFKAREDPKLYASIMACMALCIQYGAVAALTLVHEWADPLGGFLFPWFDDNMI